MSPTRAGETQPNPNEFVLRSAERTFRLNADDEGVAFRWMTAFKAMQISAMADWTNSTLVEFGNMVGWPADFLLQFISSKGITGESLIQIKDIQEMVQMGYGGRSDTVWAFLHSLRTPEVFSWLERFSAFYQKNAQKRQLKNHEMMCLIRLGRGLELMNSIHGTNPASLESSHNVLSADIGHPPSQQPVLAPAPAPAPAPVPAAQQPYTYDYGDDNFDGPIADDV